MIDNNELGSRLRVLASFFGIGFASQKTCLEAADALEAQARENALIKDEALTWKICYERTSDAAQDLELIRNELTVERDELRAELDAIKAQETVGRIVSNNTMSTRDGDGQIYYVNTIKSLKPFPSAGTELYAAPVAPAQPVSAELVIAAEAMHANLTEGEFVSITRIEALGKALANAKVASVQGHGQIVKIIGIGPEYRPDEHDRGVWLEEDGVCVEYTDGYRDCFYVSELTAAAPRQEQKGGE